MYVVKLCGYCSSDVSHPVILDYYASCDVLPYKVGYGLVGKTLQTHQSHFCRHLPEMGDQWIDRFALYQYSVYSLTLCLRRTTSTIPLIVDYAFDLWANNRDHLMFTESLLSTLKTCLPRFILASGSQIGDELRVIAVHEQIPTGTRIDLFKLPADNGSSQPPVKEFLDDISGGKAIILGEKTDPNSDSDCFFVGDYDVSIFATIKDNAERVAPCQFFTRTSYTLAYVKEKNKFNLDPETYTMEFEVIQNKGTLNTDKNMATCIKLWRSVANKSGIDTSIRVLVEKKVDQ